VSTAPTQAQSVEVAPAAVPAPVNEPPVSSSAPATTEQPRAPVPTTQPVTEPAARVEPAAANTVAAEASASVRLRLEFSEPSWVEVHDANGQRLLYDIAQPGRARVVSGTAPLNVVVGLASAVSVQVNDQAIVVPRQANRDSTRFRVAADGSVR
jgi:cytoskeleton protein RodZ